MLVLSFDIFKVEFIVVVMFFMLVNFWMLFLFRNDLKVSWYDRIVVFGLVKFVYEVVRIMLFICRLIFKFGLLLVIYFGWGGVEFIRILLDRKNVKFFVLFINLRYV